MTHKRLTVPILLVALILASLWRNVLDPLDGTAWPINFLLATISVAIVVSLLVLDRRSVVVGPAHDDSEARERWRREMESYIRMSANGHVRDALRRQAAKDARAAQALRDRGKYGMRRAGSSNPVPETYPPDLDAPTRVRSPAAPPGSGPSSS